MFFRLISFLKFCFLLAFARSGKMSFSWFWFLTWLGKKNSNRGFKIQYIVCVLDWTQVLWWWTWQAMAPIILTPGFVFYLFQSQDNKTKVRSFFSRITSIETSFSDRGMEAIVHSVHATDSTVHHTVCGSPANEKAKKYYTSYYFSMLHIFNPTINILRYSYNHHKWSTQNQ